MDSEREEWWARLRQEERLQRLSWASGSLVGFGLGLLCGDFLWFRIPRAVFWVLVFGTVAAGLIALAAVRRLRSPPRIQRSASAPSGHLTRSEH